MTEISIDSVSVKHNNQELYTSECAADIVVHTDIFKKYRDMLLRTQLFETIDHGKLPRDLIRFYFLNEKEFYGIV